MQKSKLVLINIIICSLCLAILLSACQRNGQTELIEVPAITADPQQGSTPQNTKSTEVTSLNTPPAHPSPVIPPDFTPPAPKSEVTYDQYLPQNIKAMLALPENVSWTTDSFNTDYYITAIDLKNRNALDAATQWTYVLVAPFFTVTDEITLRELSPFLSHFTNKNGDLPDQRIWVQDDDFDAVRKLAGIEKTSTKGIKKVANGSIKPDPSGDHWAIIPFEQLSPEWKVIAIDGISPLDHKFDPDKYAFTMHIALMSVIELAGEGTARLFPDFFPVPNRKPDQLTSLIMTGVTAMARDTAFIMETEGVLFPGTEIRDLMRAADLTHISNEVSFYEGCKFPDPDYEGFIFCSNPEYIKLLDDLKADIIELTGNHNNDVYALYKVDSVPFTLDLYREYGMQWYAGGVNIAESKKPLLIEHNGNRLAFVGCNSYGPEMAWASEDGSGAAPCEDFGWIKDEIKRLRAEGYLPIVTFQSQEYYIREPHSSEVRDYLDVAGAGAVIVNGSQSHVARAIEFYDKSFVHYGLGNLFFDQPDYYITYNSFIQEHFFFAGQHISTRLHTITIEETGKPRPMTLDERQDFLAVIFWHSEHLGRRQ
ncbi:MAG: hypothetical protein GX853_04010 [Chloroflexi bacterium]|nr:hypothetical protein [Chloroflexota bacterium]